MVNLLVDPPIGVIVILENVSKKMESNFHDLFIFPRDSSLQQVEMSNTYFEQQCTI